MRTLRVTLVNRILLNNFLNQKNTRDLRRIYCIIVKTHITNKSKFLHNVNDIENSSIKYSF